MRTYTSGVNQTETAYSMTAQWLGRVGTVLEGSCRVEYRVADAKQAWGKTRLLVTPVAGSGAKWIEADRFAPDKK